MQGFLDPQPNADIERERERERERGREGGGGRERETPFLSLHLFSFCPQAWGHQYKSAQLRQA